MAGPLSCMARPWRIEYEGACYHVINRGNYRRNLFLEDGAGGSFEGTLGEAAERFGWRVHAYVIMRNHFHLAVELTEPNLSDGMKWLQGTWIRRYNGTRGMIGRPFQGRYKALLVEPGRMFGRVCTFIHLNPVRARVVEPDRAEDYALGSLPKFVAKGKRPGWLDPSTLLATAGGLPDTGAGWRRYLDYLEFQATDESTRRELVAKQLSIGWCLGGAKFKKEQQEEAKRRGVELEQQRISGLTASEVKGERFALWEERLVAFADLAKVDLKKLEPKKSHPDKVLLAAAMKRTTSVSNPWLATRLDMGKPASASQFIRRYLLEESGSRAVDSLLSKGRTGH